MIPGLKRLPIFKLLAIAEVAMLAGHHMHRLDADDRKRLLELLRHPRSLTEPEKVELRAIVAKLEPRMFLGAAAEKFSPVPLPNFVTRAKQAETAREQAGTPVAKP